MKYNTSSRVEAWFENRQADRVAAHGIRTVITDNYVELGQLTALRFLEWVCLNPGGVVALPTGRTPEFFIRWMEYYLTHWDKELNSGLLGTIGFDPRIKPDFGTLHFFQLDEFFPINPEHERSFTWFVNRFYIQGFGFDPAKVRLIDTWNLKGFAGYENLGQVFPDGLIDLNLRVKKASNGQEELKQRVIRHFDSFCQRYEDEIRGLGGIGFFLGGIGPDGHVAFNVRGSSHHSHTRLTGINYETQAAAATDLGGIELVRKKAVITMGLETITYNPECVAIIIAAGESKAGVVANALTHAPALEFPASALQKLPAARMFLSRSAAVKLPVEPARLISLYETGGADEALPFRLLADAALNAGVSLMELARMNEKEAFASLPGLETACKMSQKHLSELAVSLHEELGKKIESGVNMPVNQRIMHTGPHHDDIELAYFPLLHHLVRSPHNDNHFVYCTSGFTAVTLAYVIQCLENLADYLQSPRFKDIFTDAGMNDAACNRDDITGYLKGIAGQEPEIQHLYVASRIARQLYIYHKMSCISDLAAEVRGLLKLTSEIEPGRREPDIIHKIKGWLREFEAELVWAHFGIDIDHVAHLHLKFYSDDIFPRYPDFDSDVLPILDLLETIRPTIVSLALDPEGSGPDTHYKTLIALAEALDHYVARHPDMNLHIWGYRNVWSRYHPTDVNRIIPVSLNSFAVLHNMFNSCFISQKSASFPSYEHDGTFSELAQKIWVEQHEHLVKLMGKDYFYNSPNPMLRRAYGAIYLKDMTYAEFTAHIRSVRRLLEARKELEGIPAEGQLKSKEK